MLPINCTICQLVRLTLTILAISVFLTNPLWLLLLTTTVNYTWLQLYVLTAIAQFHIHAALYIQNQLKHTNT